jgi:hypothetical protein
MLVFEHKGDKCHEIWSSLIIYKIPNMVTGTQSIKKIFRVYRNCKCNHELNNSHLPTRLQETTKYFTHILLFQNANKQ